MEDYNFWADVLDTYETSADWLKVLWLIIPPAFVLALVWLFRRRVVRTDAIDGELLYTVCREPEGLIHIYRHSLLDDADPGVVLLEQHPAATKDRNASAERAATWFQL